jgi:hypothetical protein
MKRKERKNTGKENEKEKRKEKKQIRRRTYLLHHRAEWREDGWAACSSWAVKRTAEGGRVGAKRTAAPVADEDFLPSAAAASTLPNTQNKNKNPTTTSPS